MDSLAAQAIPQRRIHFAIACSRAQHELRIDLEAQRLKGRMNLMHHLTPEISEEVTRGVSATGLSTGRSFLDCPSKNGRVIDPAVSKLSPRTPLRVSLAAQLAFTGGRPADLLLDRALQIQRAGREHVGLGLEQVGIEAAIVVDALAARWWRRAGACCGRAHPR